MTKPFSATKLKNMAKAVRKRSTQVWPSERTVHWLKGGFGTDRRKVASELKRRKKSKRFRRIRVKENEAWDFPCERRWYREIFALCTNDVQRAFLYGRKFQRGGI